MKIERYKSNLLYRHAVISACSVSLTVLLSACGSGTEDSTATIASATGNASISAAQLAADDTNTLSLAQAAAAGLVTVESVETSTTTDAIVQPNAASISAITDATGSTPELGEANSAAEEVTTDSTVPVANTGDAEPVETDEPTTDVTTAQTADSQEAEGETETAPEQTADNQETEGENEAAPAEANAEETDSDTPTKFTASNTEGFIGEVLDDGVVKINWVKDPTARGYNFYRGGEYIGTVFEEEYIDSDTFDESYYYEVQAFDFDENYNYIARGLTVDVTGSGRINPDAPVPNENILDGYELVFSDEFNGTELDSSKWVTQYLWGDELVINSEEQHYVDILNKPDFGYNPFSFDGESVTISAIPTPDELNEKAFGQKYLSGVFTSYDAFKFTYGYVEARVQLPYGQGLWPAFWLLNAYYVDDKPEIDIMEFIGHNQDVVYHTYHYFDADGTLRSTHSEPTTGTDWTNGWHKFGVEWQPGVLVFYVNDIEVHRIVDSKVSSQEMYIIANTALGGWWPGSPDASTPFPAEYKIDYIRAYQSIEPLMSDPNEGQPSELLLWDDVPGASPSHLPPFELFPQGYPERAVQ